MDKRIEYESHDFLPTEFLYQHNFAFLYHDIMCEFLQSGEEKNIFKKQFLFDNEEEAKSFKQTQDVFEWLEHHNKTQLRAEVLRATVFPAVLSDFLHFIFEALDCSRKEKLTVAFALLRKPIQENLYVLESIALDPEDFAKQLSGNPAGLHGPGIGGVEAHYRHISDVLIKLNLENQFDAQYLANLRYEKSGDCLAGTCDLALHLFTKHPKIKTEDLNINFIFSKRDEHITQWAFLYGRLPYILAYAWEMVMHLSRYLAIIDSNYMGDLKFRITANSQLWWASIPEYLKTKELEKFANEQKSWFDNYCNNQEEIRKSWPMHKQLWKWLRYKIFSKKTDWW